MIDLSKIFIEKEITNASNEAKKLLSTSNIPDSIIHDVLDLFKIDKPLSLGSSVLEDVGLIRTGSTFKALDTTATRGGSLLLSNMLERPTRWASTPIQPQDMPKYLKACETFKALEGDVLWALSIDPAALNKPPLNSLFPSTHILKYMNHSPELLGVYHMYRAYGAPLMAIVSPIATILGPYWYIRYKLGLKIGLWIYITFLFKIMLEMASSGGDKWFVLGRYIVIGFYIFMFVYHIVNTIEVANLVRRMRNEVSEKVKNIQLFIQSANSIGLGTNKTDSKIKTIADLYRLLKNPKNKERLRELLIAVYETDVNVMCNQRLTDSLNWCRPTFGASITRLWGMKHVAVGTKGRSNPASLEKNLIVTGPNAGGKSTFVKSILLSIVLANSLGIANAYKANIATYDAVHSYMRIWDSPGEESLFEAEVSRCKTIVETAQALSAAGKQGVFFLDEPMHSTPPTEGAATAKALVKYMGQLPGIRIVVCTHFHSIPALEDEPIFQNVSMSVKKSRKGTYTFKYKLHPGASFQCIALDLLSERSLPAEIIEEAKRFLE